MHCLDSSNARQLFDSLNRRVFNGFFGERNPVRIQLYAGLHSVDGCYGSCENRYYAFNENLFDNWPTAELTTEPFRPGVEYALICLDAKLDGDSAVDVLAHELVHAHLNFIRFGGESEYEEHNEHFIRMCGLINEKFILKLVLSC